MSYTYEKIASNKVKLTFTVPAEEFSAAVQKAYLANRGRINVPGFRRGKAPRKVMERMYGESLFYDDALQDIFDEVYAPALDAEKIEVVDRPEVNVDEVGEGKDLKFTCEVFVKPDVTLGDYKNLTVEVPKAEVTEDEISARIEQDRAKVTRTIEVEDRPVENGDIVNLDYAGTVDGVAFEGGTASSQTLTIGSHQFIPGFEEQMIGMKLDEEKDLHVTFPEKYQAEELAGKDAVFHVKVNTISTTEVPELNDDFAADVSDFDTFAEYRENIVKELTERAEKNHDVAVENALIEKAAENAQVDIPIAMINSEIDYLVRDMQMQMAYSGLRLEDYMRYTGQTMQQLREMRRPDAERRVKMQLVIEAIRKAENVEPSEEDIEKVIADQAERMGQELETFKAGLTDEQRESLKESAAAQKAIDLMKETATVTDKQPEAEEKSEEKSAE